MKFIKLYWLYLLSFIIFLGVVMLSVNDVIRTHNKSYDSLVNSYNKYCTLVTEERKNACLEWKREIDNGYSGIMLYQETIVNKYFPKGIIYVLFIVVPGCYLITKYFKDRMILSENNRRSYVKNLLNIFKKSYVVSLIPSIVLLLVFIYYFKYTGRFSLLDYEASAIVWNNMDNPWLFIFVYLINIIITNLIYINVCILISRKYHNYFVSVILSFLTIIGIELFLEIVVSGIVLGNIFNVNYGILFNIINAIPFNDSYGIVWPVVFSMCMNMVIMFIIYLIYRNKEKLIIDVEKNG